jgi:hypothetical protein
MAVRRRRSPSIALSASLMLLGACNPHAPGSSRPATGRAFVSLFSEGTQRQSASVVQGTVLVYTAEVLSVTDDLRVEQVSPVSRDSGLDLLDIRLTRPREANGVIHQSDAPGGGCFKHWPPAGLGTTFPAAGAELHRGEQVTVNFYVRASQLGRHSSDGVRIVYRRTAQPGRRLAQTFTHGPNTTMTAYASEAALPPVDDPNQPSRCAFVFDRWATSG